MTTNPPFEMRVREWLVKYEHTMQKNGLYSSATNWIALGIGSALIGGITAFVVFSFLGLDSPALLGIVSLLCILDIVIGYPLALDLKRVSLIEEAFPNVLKQLSDTLKAGGTYEFALRELSESDYGPLTEELKLVLRRIEEGENLDRSLELMKTEIDSRLVQRTLTIIIDALKSGGGLSEVLEDIANDMRELRRIQLERKSKTTLQTLFLITAGALVGPAILAFSTSIIEFLITTSAGTGAVSEAKIVSAIQIKQLIVFLLTGFIVIETIAASILISLMREGKAKKSIIYMPMLMFTALLVFYVTRILTRVILGGI